MHLLNTMRHIGRGMLMGTADVIPGVSGGTMALVVGIYTRLIHAIRRFDLKLLQLLRQRQLYQALLHIDAALLIPLVIGIISALFIFTRVISLPLLLQTHPEPIYALFFGLILGSIKLLLSEQRYHHWWWFVGGVVAGLMLVTSIPVATPNAAWFIFACGVVAICAMMLPGISGSFVLLLLHKYEYIFTAIGYLQLHILIPFFLGSITGLLFFSRLLAWLLTHFYSAILQFMGGLLLSSLWIVWPFQLRQYERVGSKQRQIAASPMLPENFDTGVWMAVALMLLGFVLVLVLARFGARKPSDA